MSAIALKTPPAAPIDWRGIVAEIAPQLAAEEARADASNSFVAGNYKLLRERGFLELGVPAELGGHGLTRTELAAVLRTLAHHCSATALAFAMHTHPVAAAAWRWRNQKAPTDGLLRRVAAERIQLLSSGGSDWLPGSGTATKVEGGYRIDARKVFASGAPTANVFMTTAIEQTEQGPTVLMISIPMSAKGVSIVETWDTLGMRGSASHDVVLDGVFVPDAAVGGRRPAGVWHPSMHIIAMVAFPLIYGVYTGIAEAARDIAVAAAAKRADTASLEMVGELHNECTAAGLAHDAMVAFAETAQPGADTTNAIFTYKALIARSALETVDLALEVAGGAGYFKRAGLERLFRDIQGARFHPLRSVPQRQLAGRLALGLPIDG
jgi:acyl-CoA dehydrogenase